MRFFSGRRVRRVLALFWTLATIFLLLGISVAIFRDAKFPLNLGSIQTTGRTGLWATLLPGFLGLAGVLLLIRHLKLGAGLLGLYSGFWTVVLLAGLPSAWNAKQTFCITSLGFCITTPWLTRLMVVGLATPFLLVALWSWREAPHDT